MDQLSEEELRRTIEVRGLPEDADPDDVYGFFENARFGGGEIANLELRSMTDGATFITFRDERVVDSLLSRQTEKKIRVCGNPIEIRRYEKPEPVPVIGRTIVVSGIPSNLDQDDILGFFENARKGGGPAENISAGETEGVSLITFAEQSVAAHFVELGEVTFGGNKLQIAWPMSAGGRGNKVEEETVCPRTIIIHNIAEDNVESLELSLESRRSGGGKLESVCRNPDGSVAATFVEEKVAAKFLERRSVKIAGKEYEVTKPSARKGQGKTSVVQQVPNTIEVSGIPESTSEEFLKMYFENKKRAGGGDIKTMTYNRQEGVATITFAEPSAVLNIIEKGEHKIGADVLQVIALESLTSDLIDQVCAVRVTKIPPTMSKDFLEVYFESAKRSGGEEFDEFLFDKDGGCAVIVYKSPEVCKRVTSRTHQLESVQLAVEALKPAPPPPIIVGETDEKKLLAGDLPPDFKEKELKVYLESAAGCPVIQFNHGSQPDLVLVDFKNIPNYAALRKLVVSRPFQGQMIFVQKVRPSACLLVHGTESFSDDLLLLHFENSKRSGGGEIKGIRRHGKGDVIIEFHDRKVIPTVLKKKQVIENQHLKTELFYDCLTGSSGSISRRQKVRIPENVILPVEKRILKFVSDSAKIRAQMESDMEALHCLIQWQKPEDEAIKLCCTLTPESKDVVKLAAKWETTCSEHLIAQLKRIVVKDENVSAEIWEEFVKESKPLKKSGVSAEMDQSSCTMCVVGLDDAVADYLKRAAETRNRLLEELAKRKSKTFKSVTTFKPNQLQFLKTLKFPTGQPGISKDLDVTIDDHQVSFQGTVEGIHHAMILMYELGNNMHTQNSPPLNPRKAKYLEKRPVIEYFKELFEKKNLKVFWSVKGQNLELTGMTAKETNEALLLLQSEIRLEEITLDINELLLMKQEKWYSFKKDLENAFKITEITPDLHVSTVTIISTRDSIDQIENKIRAFLKQNVILEQFIPMEEGRVAYTEKFFMKEVNGLQDEMKGEGVVIELTQKKNSAGILVRGTKTCLEQAVKRLVEIQQPILCTTHESDIYGVQKYFSTMRGKESKEKIGDKNKVIVEITRQPKDAGAAPAHGGLQADGGVTGPVDKSTVNLLGGSVIKVMKGNVAECQVKGLVILIGEDLKHTDGVAKAVVEAGGKEIEEECQGHVKAKGKLLSGQIYVSKAGSLKCTSIVHVAVPPWQNGTKREVDCLEEGMWKALETAERNGWKSLAISAGMNYPPAVATKTIVDTVEEFLEERKNLKVEVRLIDATDQVVNHFHEMLIAKFGKNAVIIGETQQSNPLLPLPVRVGTTLDQLSLIQTNYQPGKDASTLLTPEGVQVTLIKGSIATEQVDVIVNTASKELDLNQGGVSNTILQAAGANLQTECKTKMPNGLPPGQILVTAGYNLKCKHVYHGVCEKWDEGKGNSSQVIRDLLKKAFSTGQQNKMTSIAIPALGTGNLGTPREIVSAIMYAEAEEFSKANPNTALKDIRFVVFDQPTVDVFQEHVTKLRNPTAMSTEKTQKNKLKRQLKPDRVDSSFTPLTPEETIPPAKEEIEAAEADISLDIPMKTIKIKSLMMEIKQGDITQENTDAIVNSTNQDLNLYGGAVTKAILQAGGSSIGDECRKLGKTNKNGVAVTPAGNLKCKCIIHLATPEMSRGNAPEGKAWEERIFHCLKEAERIKLTSVAFPLLGTGKCNISAGEMAVNILNAVGHFAVQRKPKHLKLIRVTIFQPTMVDEFFNALTKRLSEKKSTKGFWGKFTEWFSSFTSPDSSENNNENDGFEMLEDHHTSPLVDYKCVFRVYGLSQSVMDQVIVELENLVKEAVTDKVLDNPDHQKAIAKLTPEQIRHMERDAANYQVRATVEQGHRLNRIRLQGDAKDITEVVVNVINILKEVEVAELKRNEAERIAQQAHWEYEDADGSYESYPTEINAIIERAFQSRVGFAEWEESDGQFKIDFKTNTEENLKNQTKVNVRRIGDAPIEEPKNWDPMNPGEGCKLVQVSVGSKEYDEVEQRIKATCQQSCKEIMKVERIQNHSLYQQYAVKKLHMEASAGTGATVERILWHGTSEQTVPQINAHGFNRSYCGKNATAYGKGVYFARDWTYSAHTTYSPPNAQGFKFIYQARVLTGEFTCGSQELIESPPKPNKTIERYDSVVDNITNPGIFVVFRDAQVYPEYLITFI